jgi:uncharacterized protein YegL
MSSLLEKVPISRRTMVLFFVLDTSGSRMGPKIGEVNSMIRELILELEDFESMGNDSPDYPWIKIAALEFSSGARWLTPNGPLDARNFVWGDLQAGTYLERVHWIR